MEPFGSRVLLSQHDRRAQKRGLFQRGSSGSLFKEGFRSLSLLRLGQSANVLKPLLYRRLAAKLSAVRDLVQDIAPLNELLKAPA